MDDITVKQINLMKHAIGIDKDKIKRYKYDAYRNYYTTADKESNWDDLVEKGYATSRRSDKGIGDNPIIYFVSKKGLEFLSELLYIKITEMD